MTNPTISEAVDAALATPAVARMHAAYRAKLLDRAAQFEGWCRSVDLTHWANITQDAVDAYTEWLAARGYLQSTIDHVWLTVVNRTARHWRNRVPGSYTGTNAGEHRSRAGRSISHTPPTPTPDPTYEDMRRGVMYLPDRVRARVVEVVREEIHADRANDLTAHGTDDDTLEAERRDLSDLIDRSDLATLRRIRADVDTAQTPAELTMSGALSLLRDIGATARLVRTAAGVLSLQVSTGLGWVEVAGTDTDAGTDCTTDLDARVAQAMTMHEEIG